MAYVAVILIAQGATDLIAVKFEGDLR